MDCPLLNDEAKRASHEAAQAIAAHQYADWRDLRFEPFTTPQVGKTIAKLAVQIRDALDRVATTTGKTMRSVGAAQRRTRRVIPGAKAARRSGRKSKPATREDTEIQPQTEGLEEPSSRSEPPTLVVDPMHRGDHATISECIEAANPGGRILVRPGLYQEGLVIEKPLEIIGDGDLDEIIIQAVGTNAVLFKTTMGRLANLTLRQMGSETFHCVKIVQGRLELEGCDVASQSLSCVSIHHGADPRLRRNRIHDSSQCGVIIYENGQGTLEDNDIFANTYSRVEITKGASPTLRHNRIHDNEQAGVHVSYSGKGTLEDNDIFGNDKSGMAIKEGGYPTVRRNRITRNTYVGVWVYEQGGGIFEDNDLRDNAAGPWDISSDSEAKVKASGNLE